MDAAVHLTSHPISTIVSSYPISTIVSSYSISTIVLLGIPSISVLQYVDSLPLFIRFVPSLLSKVGACFSEKIGAKYRYRCSFFFFSGRMVL